jgi:Mce-associated membrane protein
MEGDAGARQLNPTDADETQDESLAVSREQQTEDQPEESPQVVEDAVEGSSGDNRAGAPVQRPEDGGRPSRLGRGWMAGVCLALVVLAAGVGVGGYLALRSHQQSEAIARNDAVALQAAKDCVSATQAPDTAAMSVAQSKIIQCSTGDFGAQAGLYASMMVDAYQAANVKVQVSEMRAAIERHNDDGSIQILVAFRTKVTNSEAADQEQGYRLRVQMAPADGTYKVAKLDQVTS